MIRSKFSQQVGWKICNGGLVIRGLDTLTIKADEVAFVDQLIERTLRLTVGEGNMGDQVVTGVGDVADKTFVD